MLILGQIEVSTSLYFDVLESLPEISVGVRPLTRLALDAPVLAAADLVLGAEERDQLDQVSALPLIYPHWHQAKTARDRLSPADLTLLGPHL